MKNVMIAATLTAVANMAYAPAAVAQASDESDDE